MLDSVAALGNTLNSFTSLRNTAQSLGELHAQASDARRRTALTLLQVLSYFAQKQFDFFVKGVTADPADPTTGFLLSALMHTTDIPPSGGEQYPVRYPFAVLVNQVASDIEVFTRALSNREPSASTPEMRTQLQWADQLAYAALQAAMTHLGIQASTVLSYFQKSPDVRIIPYAPVAIIGVPLKAVQHAYDLLATPHEVGHYVYWRSLFPAWPGQSGSPGATVSRDNWRDALLRQFPMNEDEAECARNWFEEIFADVYGCLVAGPISAVYIQEKLSGLPIYQLIEDDADHPLPALRPVIYIATLRQMMLAAPATPQGIVMKEKLTAAITSLESQWNPRLTSFQSQDFVMRRKRSPTLAQLGMAGMREVLEQIVTRLCEGLLQPLLDFQAQSLEHLWYHGSQEGAGADLQLWRDRFEEFVNLQSLTPAYPELLPGPSGEQVVLDASTGQGQSTPAPSNFGFEAVRDVIMAQGQSAIAALQPLDGIQNDNGEPRQWWQDILDANGWATQGPGPGHVGKG